MMHYPGCWAEADHGSCARAALYELHTSSVDMLEMMKAVPFAIPKEATALFSKSVARLMASVLKVEYPNMPREEVLEVTET